MKIKVSQSEICDEYLGTEIKSLNEIFETLTELKGNSSTSSYSGS